MVLRTLKSLSVFKNTCLTLIGFALISPVAIAGARDQAFQMFNRLNGVPPSSTKLDEMAGLITAGDMKGAALAAINDNGGMFYNLMLKDVVARWTNTDNSPRVPLNDYVATVIGMVRDDIPFNTVLSGDIVYTGNTTGAPAYSLANNAHYQFLDDQGVDLKAALVQQKQSLLSPSLPADATAGVMTTRAFADSYYKAGTNRRAVAFTLANFVCKDMDKLADTTRPDFRVRRDVTRAPGGDSALFRNRCAGCHAGMDAFAGAFAFYDFDDTTTALVYTPGTVRPKYNRNTTEFPDGFETTDDSWLNNWLVGQNANLGWHGTSDGNGAKAFGEMLTSSDAFAGCMAKRAVEAMCLHPVTNKNEIDAVATIAEGLRKDNAYSMKGAFAEAAAFCVQ